MNPRTACLICGKPGTTRWTINDGDRAAVVDVCPVHARPLMTLLERAGTLPQPPGPAPRDGARPPARQPRRQKFDPLDWKPPDE